MKIVEIKKLFLNKYASVRDYLVAEASEKGQDLRIVYGDRQMTIKYKNLQKGKQDAKQQFSKFNNKAYYLIDFLWKPDKEKPVHKEQGGLF